MKIPRIPFIVCLLTLYSIMTWGEKNFPSESGWPETDVHTWLVHPRAHTIGKEGKPYLFAHLRDALLAADSLQRIVPEGTFTEEKPLTILVAPWVYWIDDPDVPDVRRPLPGELIPYGLKLTLSHLRVVGLGESPKHTVVACNRGQTQGAVGNFTMFHLTGEDIQFENLTMGNYCNIDLVYEPAPELNRPKRANAIVQAQLAICQGDRISARNCHFISRLNLCPLVGAARTFFDNCYFECTDDALCGTGVYHRCKFTLFSGKPFYNTQGTGAVFLNCDLHALTRGTQYLTKVQSPVTMVDCRWTSDDPDLQIEWAPAISEHLRCYQYGLSLNSKPLFINQSQPNISVSLDSNPLLKAYRLSLPKSDFHSSQQGDTIVYNIRNLTGGKDGWNPANQPDWMEKYTDKAVGLKMNRQKAAIETGIDTLRLYSHALTFMQHSGIADTLAKVAWKIRPEKFEQYVVAEPQTDGSLILVGNNQGEETLTMEIVATHNSGLETACVLTVRPQELPAPTFTSRPKIKQNGTLLTLDYQLNLQGRDDRSEVTWWRCTSPNGEGGIPVAVSRKGQPKRTYSLTAEDEGYYLKATVLPKHNRSDVGLLETAMTRRPIRCKAAKGGDWKVPSSGKVYETDFLDFPTQRQLSLIPGFWTVDAYKPFDTREYEWEVDTLHAPWYYGHGVDGAREDEGLMQGVRGARLLYTPLPGRYGTMEITLHVSPCKTAGQGFGSATGQYMDVCLKMDTRTLSGYALRIIRTTKNDKAVDFQLMKYENGIVTPISEAVLSICYRRGCIIRLKATENELTAHVFNELSLPSVHSKNLAKEVKLAAPITDTPHGGISIQHTGSTGASATLLTNMCVKWD